MGELFTVPLGGEPSEPWGFIDETGGRIRAARPGPWLPVLVLACDDLGRLSARLYRPDHDGPYACAKCAAPVVPCDTCGNPAMCGDSWCQPCQPDG